MIQHIIASIVLLGSLFLLANPFDYWMLSQFQLLVVGAVAVITAIFIGLLFKDEGRDEREVALRAHAARAGYVAGIAVLVLSFIVEILMGMKPSVWTIVALAAMIVARLAARLLTE